MDGTVGCVRATNLWIASSMHNAVTTAATTLTATATMHYPPDKMISFADELNCSIVRKTLNELKVAMILTYEKIEEFCKSNRLKLNC